MVIMSYITISVLASEKERLRILHHLVNHEILIVRFLALAEIV